jgi:uncharacterized protein (DUF305 family)
MRISARGAAAAVMGPVILAGPLVLAPSAFAAAATPATVTAAVDQQPMSTQMIQTAQQYAAGLRHLHGAAFEQAFMGTMIPHHAAAVAMARLELTRGSNPQLKALARQITASQSREITQMTSWLHTWYGVTPAQAEQHAPASLRRLSTTMATEMSAMNRQLTAVPSGSRFDEAFLTGMTAHHKMASIEASTVPGRAIHSQLTTLARQIVATQNREIAQMTSWLHTWYHMPARPNSVQR